MIAVTAKMEQDVADVMLKTVGAETFEHGYNPIKDIALARRLSVRLATESFL